MQNAGKVYNIPFQYLCCVSFDVGFIICMSRPTLLCDAPGNSVRDRHRCVLTPVVRSQTDTGVL